MTAYVINNMLVRDAAAYAEYSSRVVPALRRLGAEVLAAGDMPVPHEGTWPYDRTVLLSFPSREAMERWMSTPEYAELAALRRAGAACNIVVLEGRVKGSRSTRDAPSRDALQPRCSGPVRDGAA